ncbi:16S rRNA methyltransferase [Pyrodictium occultum]|uniref:Ribosomal RNA small subunit methyltransferase Nep1 n=1 Tax=Pyrodictium occultum TaxID=2309 RepID=A0A0V8RUD7_PYROC|nr:16S rRNA methyltransferase [Pyrodictium occultum]KSW11676.1 16S rRNA methyltransferase [Pyrodictium occultum]
MQRSGEKPRVKLVLAEAALETVPREIWGHPAVYKSARRRGKPPSSILLDRSIHHQAMKKLPGAEKRGRPDIVHFSLLEALSSPLNREGLLEVYVHTLNDYVVFVDPSTRLPRNYNRFTGLMEQLLELGRVPPKGKPLLWLKPMKLERLLEEVGASYVILLSEDGEPRRLREVAEEALEKAPRAAVVVGAFPHGDFTEETKRLATRIYSIYRGKPLDTWTVVSHFLALAADMLNLI